jgi:hypothetical protein
VLVVPPANKEYAVKAGSPVPPYGTVMSEPFHVPLEIVPTEVKDEPVTFEARVEPVKEPAGAVIVVLPAAVTKPLPFTVKVGIML